MVSDMRAEIYNTIAFNKSWKREIIIGSKVSIVYTSGFCLSLPDFPRVTDIKQV